MSSTPDDASGRPQPGSPAQASDGPGAGPIPGLEQLTLPECREVIGHLAAQVNELQALVAVLQERLKLDSKNSSKPPSSDECDHPI
jgi:hypothetical protein